MAEQQVQVKEVKPNDPALPMPPTFTFTCLYNKDTKELVAVAIAKDTENNKEFKYSFKGQKEMTIIEFINLEKEFEELPYKDAPPYLTKYFNLLEKYGIELVKDDSAELILDIPTRIKNFVYLFKENIFFEVKD